MITANVTTSILCKCGFDTMVNSWANAEGEGAKDIIRTRETVFCRQCGRQYYVEVDASATVRISLAEQK